jgi:hypothetical protein
MSMDENALDRRLAALKEELARLDAPEDVGRRLDAAIAAAGQGKLRGAQRAGWRARESWLAWPLALAAAVGVITWTLRTPRDSVPPEIPAVAVPAATQFIPLVPVADIAQTRGAYVVSAPMPRTMLAELGLPVSPMRAAEPISSELLVRADGTVLAVRFLQ